MVELTNDKGRYVEYNLSPHFDTSKSQEQKWIDPEAAREEHLRKAKAFTDWCQNNGIEYPH